jgi:single-strand DNA-binding protein
LAALNKVILIGRLTHDPELRYTPNGQPVANFSLAVDRKLSKTDETDFIPVVAWRRLAEICNEFLHKGKLVAIEGRLQVRSYEDKEGRRQRAFEVVADEMQMLDRSTPGGGSAGGGGGGDRAERGPGSSYSSNRPSRPAMAAAPSRGGGEYDDAGGGFPPSDDSLGIDDIPF